MQTFISILLLTNTWALKERALFSINGKIFFTQEANALLKSYKYTSCILNKEEKGKLNKNLIANLIGRQILTRNISATKSVSPVDSVHIQSLFQLAKVSTIEYEYLELPNFTHKECFVPKVFQSQVTKFYNINLELNKRHRSFLNDKKLMTKSTEAFMNQEVDFRSYIFKNIKSRLFL